MTKAELAKALDDLCGCMNQPEMDDLCDAVRKKDNRRAYRVLRRNGWEKPAATEIIEEIRRRDPEREDVDHVVFVGTSWVMTKIHETKNEALIDRFHKVLGQDEQDRVAAIGGPAAAGYVSEYGMVWKRSEIQAWIEAAR